MKTNFIYGYIYSLKLKIDNRIYIGQTTKNPYTYYKETFVNHKGGDRRYLANAIKKYGINNFEFKVLTCAYCKKELDDLEIKYIKKYNSLNRKNGFNLKEGGSFGKHSSSTKNKISKSRTGKCVGLNSPRALIATIKHKFTSQEISGCMSELSRAYEFNLQSMSTRGKSRDWILIKLTTKNGIEKPLPKKSIDKKNLRGINHPNSKIATIKNIITNYEETGVMSELSKKHAISYSQILSTGKYKNWRLINLINKNGTACKLPDKTMDRVQVKGINSCRAKIATIKNTKTGEKDVGCISDLSKKYNFNKNSMSGRGKSKDWILIKLTTKDGTECKLPKIPIDKDKFKGLHVHNAKIATIKNTKTGEEIIGCASELSKKYNFNSNKILRDGKSKDWILIKLTTKDGTECKINK